MNEDKDAGAFAPDQTKDAGALRSVVVCSGSLEMPDAPCARPFLDPAPRAPRALVPIRDVPIPNLDRCTVRPLSHSHPLFL